MAMQPIARSIAMILLGSGFLLAACGGEQAAPGPTATASPRSLPTAAVPTNTPLPTTTPTSVSTATPTSTATAVPTSKPTVAPVSLETPTHTEPPAATPEATGEFFLQIEEPESVESIVSEPVITVTGRTRIDAVVSVGVEFADVDEEGRFSVPVPLEEGPNVIQVVASLESGDELVEILVLVYSP